MFYNPMALTLYRPLASGDEGVLHMGEAESHSSRNNCFSGESALKLARHGGWLAM